MTKTACLVAAFCACFCVTCPAQELFTTCSAAFLGDKIIVDDYSPSGKCVLPADAKGVLTVCTTDSHDGNLIFAKAKIKFKIALRDSTSKTLIMFADKTFEQVDIQKVLAQCKKGDHIVLLTLDNKYALPHNEILVM